MRGISAGACLFAFALALVARSSSALTQGDYTYTVNNGLATISKFNASYSGALSVTNSLGGYPVTAIGINAFYSCKGISSVTIPNGVSIIGNSAFRYSGLSSITIPGSIVSIGDLAFNCCFSLTNLVIGIGVKSIRNNAFSNCWGLPSIIIPNSVTNIEGFAFADCYALTSVALPASLKSIGGGAFGGCRSLIAIDVMEGNQHYSNVSGVLFDMQQQTIICFPASKRGEYTIPASVTTVGEGAFFECMGLTAISIPANVASIGDGAFYDCTSLKSITIPHSVTNIGESAFLGCNRLSNIFFNGNVPTLGGSNTFYSTSATIYYLPGTTGWSETYGDRPTLCWNPTIPYDAEFGFLENEFGFNINGTPNIPVVIEASTNLSSGLWVPIITNTLGDSGSIYFSDAASTDHASRFYRIVWP